MGYYTSYSLDFERRGASEGCGHEPLPDAKFCPECGHNLATPFTIHDAVVEFAEKSAFPYSMRQLIDGTNDTWKWYAWERDMKQISAAFPGYLFTLDGAGEESGDIWRAYFLDGKCQHEKAVLTIADFDESKLV